MMNYNERQQISSPAENQNPVLEQEINAYLKQKLGNQNFTGTQQEMLKKMLLNNEQGSSLLKNYLNSVCDAIIKNNAKTSTAANDNLKKFFDMDGRNEVINYLKNSNMDFDNDEIQKISTIVEKIENSAIDRYLKQKAREKTMLEENEYAKQKLKSNAQNSGYNSSGSKIFTREQIGKMSSAEFAKNEKLIMEQLRQGLIQ